MAVTGLGAIGFLIVHMGGNLFIFRGQDQINSYAHHLHSLPFLPVLEVSLFALFAAHIILSIVVTLQNQNARPIRYAVNASAGASNLSSSTMIYSGIAILAFIAFHIWHMKFSHSAHVDEYIKVTSILGHPIITIGYILGILAVGLHLFHGANSAFQSLGLRYPKFDYIVEVGGRVCALTITFGFISIPVYVWFVLRGG